MTMLTAEQALELLRANPGAYTTPDALRALAAQVGISASGSVTAALQQLCRRCAPALW